MLVLFFALASCKTARTKLGAEGQGWTGEAGKSVGVQCLWIKNRGYEVHVSLKINNQSDEAAEFTGEWITMEANGVAGKATKSPPILKVAAAGGKSVLMKYRFVDKVPKKGEARIVVHVSKPEHTFDAILPMKK